MQAIQKATAAQTNPCFLEEKKNKVVLFLLLFLFYFEDQQLKTEVSIVCIIWEIWAAGLKNLDEW